ncbi:MAG: cytidine/deoxycytidylate deaminase family protein [Bacillota bacterium]
MSEAKCGDGADRRPSWDQYFLNIADVVATRSTCPRRAVGAVLVRERQILSTGYNGAPRGLAHCTEAGCIMRDGHCVRTSHAEMNAIAQAAYHGVAVKDSILYCTDKPCLICTKLLINAGIRHIVYRREYEDPVADAMIEEAGITLERIEG